MCTFLYVSLRFIFKICLKPYIKYFNTPFLGSLLCKILVCLLGKVYLMILETLAKVIGDCAIYIVHQNTDSYRISLQRLPKITITFDNNSLDNCILGKRYRMIVTHDFFTLFFPDIDISKIWYSSHFRQL